MVRDRRTPAGFCWSWAFVVSLGLFLLAPAFHGSATAADLVEATRQWHTGKYAECIESATQAIEADDFREDWRWLKLQSEMATGRYADALKTLDAALERYEYSIRLRWLGRDVCRHNNQVERAAKLTDEIGELARTAGWRFRDAANQTVLARYLLDQGFDAKQVLRALTDIKKRLPNFAEAHLLSGQLALDKHDYALAAEAFEQAVKFDSENPAAHYGLAQAFAPSDADRADAALKAALALNPRHVDSLLMLVDSHIDAELYDKADETLTLVEQVNAHHPRAWAYRAVLAHLRSDAEAEEQARKEALASWSTNPEVDSLIGTKLSQKYRFAEGAEYQRRALVMAPDYLPAKIQLANDLLRLGEEEEGWRLAAEVHERDGYNVVAYNLITLQDELRGYRTLERDGLLVRMEAREASIYGQQVLDLLARAKQQLCEKYDVTIDRPVVVELFPRQQDFAIRTFGLPGGAGFLGVCFGHVITANSPASQAASPSNWQATLWHEFCHVVTLHKTNNKMPRWLSEGISVYEERQADATWGQAISPRYRAMMLGDELTPVSELSGAFLDPPSPLHLQFAYYESSLVVEYLVDKYGLETLQRILVDLGVGMPINDALARYTGSLAALDKEFAEYARQQAESMAPAADWTSPELTPRADLEAIDDWLKEHPNNYPALQLKAMRLVAAKQWEPASRTLDEMRRLYPQDISENNPHRLLAQVYRETNNPVMERAVLESFAALSADDLAVFQRLVEMHSSAGDWASAAKFARRILAVNPLQRFPHESLARAAEQLGDDPLAIDANNALLALEPIDLAGLHFQLATLHHRAGRADKAKRHVLLALEEAPRYRAAHELLLKLVEEK